jgi:hypothetical protein
MLGDAGESDLSVVGIATTRPAVLRGGTEIQIDPLCRKLAKSTSEGNSDAMGEILLGQIMVDELLDSDQRPTFIIDLGNPINTSPGALKTLLANQATRAMPGLLDTVC